MTTRYFSKAAAITALLLATASAATAAPAPQAAAISGAWMNKTLSPDQRTAALIKAMTEDEKLTLVFGYFGSGWKGDYTPAPEAREGSAGYVPGIPRLGIPPQWETDAGIGVATQGSAKQKRERTALPSGIATAATWNPDLAQQGGAMIGDEARNSGFNVMLAGGVDLLREPRGGRNFEYGGEDPLLAGTMVGEQIAGIQSNHIVSTVKHYAMNDQETGRNTGNAVIGDRDMRMSDLLAFQIAIETGRPGSVMCSYNLVNGTHACENPYLLTDVLRRDWGFKGYVMSDWGATHSTVAAANAGLDQDSGFPFDTEPFFGKPLKAAIQAGQVKPATLDRMAGGVLHAMFSTGLFDAAPAAPATIDYDAHAKVSQADAEQGIVLLKNADNILPLSRDTKSIVIIGGHADKGVLAGGGSSLVYPRGGNAVPEGQPATWPGPVIYYPSSPMAAIKAQAPGATVSYVDGSDPAAAAAAARKADVAIVFVTQWTGESFDAPITLADNQDALVTAVAGANKKTVVVAETGGPVLMPWADRVAGIFEAWYPGTAGGAAIGNLLFGTVNPSGHLPATFPAALNQLVRPGEIDPSGEKENDPVTVNYTEGAAVGYKWFDQNKLTPAFAFGHGLSYTDFAFAGLKASAANGQVTASFTVTNTGKRQGMAVPQLYVGAPSGGDCEAPKRLAGWQKIDLAPAASQTVSVSIDPRLLASYDVASRRWQIAAGDYQLMLAHSARDIDQTVTVHVEASSLPVGWHPAA
ncbi:glycosyl hydrolase [Sphingomonas koreensis]|nr:glycosyl hydrolase [Sphingomonas koreensis]